MLATDPKQRPSADEISKKKFLRNWINRSRIQRLKESKKRSSTEVSYDSDSTGQACED
jgi:hypothetical protein